MEPTRGEGQAVHAGVVRACRLSPTEISTPLQLLARPQFAWVTGETAIAVGGSAATLTAAGDDRFTDIRERATALFAGLHLPDSLPAAPGPRLYGGFSFTDTHQTDSGEPWQGYPDGLFVLPAVQVVTTPDETWLTTAAVGPDAHETATERLDTWRARLEALPRIGPRPPAGVGDLTYTPTRETWRNQVGTAVERIQRGPLTKVVLAQSLTATLSRPAAPADILTRLGDVYPDCDRFLFTPESGRTFFGATPERLVSVRGNTVETEALAGSTGRGQTPADDSRLASDLRESPKNRHEHDLVVRAICDQLETVASDIERGDLAVRRLATLQHLRTPIRARVRHDRHVLELVEALHPTPAVGGLPPTEALATIRETEAFDRGWYAAPIGWFDADGDGTFAVAIRSGLASDRTVTMFAGAGIVADSDPDQEWEELQLKYRPILDELS